MEAQNPVTYVVTPEGRLIDPAQCWAVTLTGEENEFNNLVKAGNRTLGQIVDHFKGGDLNIVFLAPAENLRAIDDTDLYRRIKGHGGECECSLCYEGERRYMEWATDTGREPY